MTTEPSQDGGPAKRKFDDVTSLFGTIVPPPGTPIRPMRPFQPIPTSLPGTARPADDAEPEPIEPPLEPDGEYDRGSGDDPEPPRREMEPSVSARPRPTEIPWPDAFEPRPNFKPREPRQWTWLLLIPAGLVAAAAMTLIDTRNLRRWVDANLLHRAPIEGTITGSLLPGPFQPRSAPDLAAAPPAQAPIPYPAIPTSPVPVPPGTEVSPPPVDPAQAAAEAAAAAPVHVIIQYRRNVPGAEGEARRLATLLQGVGGSIELRPNATTVRSPTINYYNSADKDSASALALILAHEATSWTVRPGTGKNPLGTLDVWLP